MPPGSIGKRLARAYDRAIVALDAHRIWILTAWGVLYFAVTAVRARATPFWHDEIYTLLLSRLSTLRDVWRAPASWADLMPPLNLFLTRAAESLAGGGPVSSRLPAMLGSIGGKPYDAVRNTGFVMYDDGSGWLTKQLRDDGIVEHQDGRELGAGAKVTRP